MIPNDDLWKAATRLYKLDRRARIALFPGSAGLPLSDDEIRILVRAYRDQNPGRMGELYCRAAALFQSERDVGLYVLREIFAVTTYKLPGFARRTLGLRDTTYSGGHQPEYRG